MPKPPRPLDRIGNVRLERIKSVCESKSDVSEHYFCDVFFKHPFQGEHDSMLYK